MRIAFLVAHFPRLSETFILNQVTGLIDRGHKVDIFAQYIEDWTKVHPDVESYCLQKCTYQLPDIPQNYSARILKGIWFFLLIFSKAPNLLLRSFNVLKYGEQAFNLWLLYSATVLIDKVRTYDIIHCQFGTLGYQGLAFKRLLSPTPKLLLMFRGFDISCYVKQGGAQLYQKLFNEADYCLTNCEFFRQRIIDLGCQPEKVSIHFSGLDVNKFQFGSRYLKPGETVHIASTGRLVEKKGFEYAIKAVALQHKQTPNLQYVIIGDGPLKEELKKLIDELDAGSFIHLVGWRNEAEIIEILNECHIFLAPSITASDGNQDAPINVLKEAMALGLPVISTHHGGIPELVEDEVSGFLVPERNVEALVQKLNYLITHTEQGCKMGKAGRDFVERYFNLNHLNNQLVSRYETLVRNSNKGSDSSIHHADQAIAAPIQDS